MTTLTAVSYDNRGTSESAFGFVYFSDDRRVAYATNHGVVQDSTGGWAAVTTRHVTLAQEYLKDQGVPMAAEPTPV